MNIAMTGLDYSRAPIEARERLSFTKNGVLEMDRRIASLGGAAAVLLSTCNRTELYLSLPDGEAAQPEDLLCRAAGLSVGDFSGAFVTRTGPDCVRHLLEVACGLRSQILGEDQILTQVKTAVALARESGSADSVLETLFRTAAACGKAAKAGGRLSGVPTSVAHRAVEVLQERMGKLSGKKALVIGNGEMGRLAASLLREAGCAVTVTLRSYHHGETVVPAGCAVVPYDDRYQAMDGVDVLLSATTSPHYTVTESEFRALRCPPRILVDLAIPRDIQPELSGLFPELTLLNVDHLQRNTPADDAALQRINATVTEHMERFYQWNTYRESLPALEELKDVLRRRIGYYLDSDMEPQEAAEVAIDKAVDLIAGGMSEGFTAEAIRACASKIRLHTRA